MKQRVLVELKVVCDPPYTVGRWAITLEERVLHLEGWCREFEEFVRDHRSQGPVSLSVEREYQDQCSFCGNQWEEDETGPLCCNKALAEWEAQHEATEPKE